MDDYSAMIDSRRKALQGRIEALANPNNQSTLSDLQELAAGFEEVGCESCRIEIGATLFAKREAELTKREADLTAELDALEQAATTPSAAGGV